MKNKEHLCVQTGQPCGFPCYDKCPIYEDEAVLPQADVMLSLLASKKEKIKKDLFEWIRTDMYGTHDEYIQDKINKIFASNGA